jgi:hypothetical protein
MNAPTAEEQDSNNVMNVTIRLPKDLAEFVESLAISQFNTRAGIVRMAVASLKQAMVSKESPRLAKAS